MNYERVANHQMASWTKSTVVAPAAVAVAVVVKHLGL